MKSPRNMMFFLPLSLAALVLVAPISGAEQHDIANGVSVSVDATTGRNVVAVTLGADTLLIDFPGNVPIEKPPRYRLATGATGSVSLDASIELWPESRPQSATSEEHAAVVFASGFTLAAADGEAVLFDLGRCATAGDAAVWLPGERILITGRLATSERVEATPASDLALWIESLKRLQLLGPRLVIPGRGSPGGADILESQVRHLVELSDEVEHGLVAGKSDDSMTADSKLDWLVAWREADPMGARNAIEALVTDVGGLRTPWELTEQCGLREGPSPTASDPGWVRPRKVLWADWWPDRLPLLALVAPGVEIVPFTSAQEALAHVADADAIIGEATPELLAAGSRLRWVQVGSAGVEDYLAIPELGSGEVLLTNGQKLASPEIAEHVMALARALARGLDRALAAQLRGVWARSEITSSAHLVSLRHKTLLVVGLGGIGTEVARLAAAAGMRVTGIRSSERTGPPFVDRVGLTEELAAFAAEADVVVDCLPMTPDTADIFNRALFAVMKPTATFINVGRGGTVDTDALVAALENGDIAGAGLDVTDPEPLPHDHPLWRAPNVIITPHYAARSDAGHERHWLLYRENLRRFAAGQPLLSVVDPERGY